MEFGLKWVNMDRYGVILRLDGSMAHDRFWTLAGPKTAYKKSKMNKNVK